MQIKQQTRNTLSGWLFVTPWCIGTFCFFLIPFALSFVFSIFEVNPADLSFSYIGFEEYKAFFVEDAEFVPTLFGSVGETVVNVAMIVFLSLFIANILVQNFKGRTFFRAVFFMPFIISTSIALQIIKGDSSLGDVVNNTQSAELQLDLLQTMFASTNMNSEIIDTIMTVLNSILNVSWKCGLQITLFMSGLQNIPTSVKEASQIEGATAWEYFWKVAFPMVSSVFQLALIYSIIDCFVDTANPIVGRINALSQGLHLTTSSAMACLYYGIVFVIVAVVFGIMYKKGFTYSN